MHTALRLAALGLAVTALGTAAPEVQARPGGWGGHAVAVHGGGYHGGYHGGYYAGHYGGYRGGYGWWGPGVVLGGVALGLGIAALGSYDYYPPTYVTVTPPPVYVAPAAAVVVPTAPSAAAPAAMVDPVIYPRNGQSAAQTEADRQDCQRWATTQPRALSDGSVYQRGVFACMDARGYTLR